MVTPGFPNQPSAAGPECMSGLNKADSTWCHIGGPIYIYYNITKGGMGGSTEAPNMYYVTYERPLTSKAMFPRTSLLVLDV